MPLTDEQKEELKKLTPEQRKEFLTGLFEVDPTLKPASSSPGEIGELREALLKLQGKFGDLEKLLKPEDPKNKKKSSGGVFNPVTFFAGGN